MTFQESIERAKSFLLGRKQAYHEVFNLESREVEIVLRDLAQFCRAHRSTFESDPRLHAVLEGRREVWIRITQHLNLNEEELWKLHGRKE